MAFFSKNGSGKQADSNRKRRHSLNAWLLYFGIASMGLTGVTFSKYSTTITGTITVQEMCIRDRYWAAPGAICACSV